MIMTTLNMPQQVEAQSADAAIQTTINTIIDELMASLPDPKQLSSEQRRGIIARYSSVLEGNFVYWMTAAVIAVKSEDAREELLENLHEEVRDAHPAMLRRFAIAAHAFPTDVDALAVNDELTKVRLFLGRLSAVQSLVTMAFFEGFIQRFMAYLADLAADQGSTEMEYTDVHGVCDIEHTQGLFRALADESTINPLGQSMDLYEGVYLLRSLIDKIVFNKEQAQAA
jgi:hypothetical protein